MRIFRLIIIFLVSSFSVVPVHSQINTDQVMNVGRNALYFEDYVLSIQYFNQVIAAKPYLAQPYFYRGYAKFCLDDLKGAEKDVSQSIEHNPFLTDAYELRGVIRQNQGKSEQALEDYEAALKMLPENRSLLFNKANVLSDLKRYDESLSTFDKLIKRFPRFENAYIGKARLLLERNDTVEALNNVGKALELNRNSLNAHLLEAEINMNGDKEKRAMALNHMDEAIKLNPKNPGFFINRAYLRHKQDDYFGAMSDYDYAIQLDPDNFVAHYNRAMLCTEVRDFDKALADFNEVIRINPNEHRTLYNRAIVYREKQDYKNALADVTKVIESFPTLAAAYFLRYDIKRSMGDRTAQRDLDKSLALAKERIKVKGKEGASKIDDLFGTPEVDDDVRSDNAEDEAQETVAARFSSLLTVNNNIRTEQELNNKTIRGRIQDRRFVIETEPLITLTYFISPTELRPSSDYIKELDEVNRTRALRFLLQATCHEASLIDTLDINRHFESIAYYNSYLANHTPRAIDYFGRAMDHFTLRNYKQAATDFTRAIDLTPNFVLAYFMRAVSKYKLMSQDLAIEGDSERERTNRELRGASLSQVLEDFNQVIKLSPTMPSAYYNKGTILIEQGDLTSAIAYLTKAIELKADFGEAYYNRGYAYMKLGNRTAGVADLSKAGELGIVPSYNVLKRIAVK